MLFLLLSSIILGQEAGEDSSAKPKVAVGAGISTGGVFGLGGSLNLKAEHMFRPNVYVGADGMMQFHDAGIVLGSGLTAGMQFRLKNGDRLQVGARLGMSFYNKQYCQEPFIFVSER